MALVGYARVSSTDQDLTVQLEALAAAGCNKIFHEKVSGTSTANREELEKCLEWVRDTDVLVVTRLDRMARSVLDMHAIAERLRAKGVEFRCLQQPIDTTTAEGRLMFSMLAAFAEFETDIRRNRQAEGIARAKANGVYSQKAAPKATAADIAKLKADGLGAKAIAVKLGINKATVYRLHPEGWGPPILEKG